MYITTLGSVVDHFEFHLGICSVQPNYVGRTSHDLLLFGERERGRERERESSCANPTWVPNTP